MLRDLGNYLGYKRQSWVLCLQLRESAPEGLIAKNSNFARVFEGCLHFS